jgi:hypothetical protein
LGHGLNLYRSEKVGYYSGEAYVRTSTGRINPVGKHCRECGRQLARNAKFCRHCGAETSRAGRDDAAGRKASNATSGKVPADRKAAKRSTARSGRSRPDASAAEPSGPPPEDFRAILRAIARNTISSFLKRLPLSIGIGLAVWIVHTYLLVVVNEGWHPSTTVGTFLALNGQAISGTVVWTVLAALIASLLMRRKSTAGKVTLRERIEAIRRYLAEARQDALAVLAGGIGTTLIIGSVVNNSANIVLALGFGAMLATRVGSVMALLFRSAWNAAFGVFRSRQIRHYGMAAGYTALAASLAGFAVNFVITPAGLFVGAIALAAAVFISFHNRGTGPTASVVVFALLGAAAFILVGDAGLLLADDGGWQESGARLDRWIASQGSITAAVFGLPPAVGASIGAALGPVLVDLGDALPDDILRDPSGSGGTPQDERPRGEREPLVDPWDETEIEYADGQYWIPDENGEYLVGVSREEAERYVEQERRNKAKSDAFRKEGRDAAEADWQRRKAEMDREAEREAGEAREREAEERRRREEAEALTEFVWDNVDDVTQADKYEEFIRRGLDRGYDMDRMREAIKDATLRAQQQMSMGDAEAALEEERALAESQAFAEDTRDWANRINRVATLAGGNPMVLIGQGAASAAGTGYVEGGATGAAKNVGTMGADMVTGGLASAARQEWDTELKPGETRAGRIASRWGSSLNDNYNPARIAQRMRDAESLGEFVDATLDAVDLGKDVRERFHPVAGADADGGTLPPVDSDGPRAPRPPRPDAGAATLGGAPTPGTSLLDGGTLDPRTVASNLQDQLGRTMDDGGTSTMGAGDGTHGQGGDGAPGPTGAETSLWRNSDPIGGGGGGGRRPDPGSQEAGGAPPRTSDPDGDGGRRRSEPEPDVESVPPEPPVGDGGATIDPETRREGERADAQPETRKRPQPEGPEPEGPTQAPPGSGGGDSRFSSPEKLAEDYPHLKDIDTQKQRLQGLREQNAEALGPDHPAVKAVDERIDALERRAQGVREIDDGFARLGQEPDVTVPQLNDKVNETIRDNNARIAEIEQAHAREGPPELSDTPDPRIEEERRLKETNSRLTNKIVGAQVNKDAPPDAPPGLDGRQAEAPIEGAGSRVPRTKEEVARAAVMHVEQKRADSPYQSWTTRREVAQGSYGGRAVAVGDIPIDDYRRMVESKEVLPPSEVTKHVAERYHKDREVLVTRVEHWRVDDGDPARAPKLAPDAEFPDVQSYVGEDGKRYVRIYRSMSGRDLAGVQVQPDVLKTGR